MNKLRSEDQSGNLEEFGFASVMDSVNKLLELQESDVPGKVDSFLVASSETYEPWRKNIITHRIFDEVEYVPEFFDPENINRKIIEKTRGQVHWVDDLEAKGFDLSSKDWRGKLGNLINFHEVFGFYADLLGGRGAAGVYTGVARQIEPIEIGDHSSQNYFTESLWKLFLLGTNSRLGEISTAAHEVIHSQQSNREGLPARNKILEFTHSVPFLYGVFYLDKIIPQLNLPNRIYKNYSMHESHAYLGEIQSGLANYRQQETSTYGLVAAIVNNLGKYYGFSYKESLSSTISILKIRSLCNFANQQGKLDKDDPLSNFDQSTAKLIYDWEQTGQIFDEATGTFPALEERITDYLKVLGIDRKSLTKSDENQLLDRVVQWDVQYRRADDAKFISIARDEIKQEIQKYLDIQPIKLWSLRNVTAKVSGLKKGDESWHYGSRISEYPNVFFPGTTTYPYTLEQMSGFAFSHGKYESKYTVESVDEDMQCYVVDLKNSMSSTEPEIEGIKKVGGDHMKKVYPLFRDMLIRAHEFELNNKMPEWGSEKQSLIKGLIQYRYDGLPWQYRFSGVIHGLGLGEMESELFEYMEKRINAGQVSKAQISSWSPSNYNYRDEGKAGEARKRWLSNPLNHLSSETIDLIHKKIDSLPGNLFPRDFYSGENHARHWELFLGPDIFKEIESKMDSREAKKTADSLESHGKDGDEKLNFGYQFLNFIEGVYEATPEFARDIIFFMPIKILELISNIQHYLDYYKR